MTTQCWNNDERLEERVFLKMKIMGFSVSHCRQAKLHVLRLHAES